MRGFGVIAASLFFSLLPNCAAAQTVSGWLFGGTGAFVCCQGHATAWEWGGGFDALVVPSVSRGDEFSVVGPFGTGQVNEYSGPYVFGTAQFGSDPHAAFGTTHLIVVRAGVVFR